MCLLVISANAAAPTMSLKVGQVMPPLHFAEVVQGDPEGMPHAGYRLIVEYWSTTCARCVANIDHINELYMDYYDDDEPVDVLLVTNDKRSTVEAFLKTHPMKGAVVIDPGFATNRGLVDGDLPVVALVGSAGKIVAITRPERVTNEVVDAMTSGKELPLDLKN